MEYAPALAKVDDFVAQHGDLTRQGISQPTQAATNVVVFVRRGEEILVFKVFCEPERKERECFALRHWRSKASVPELIWDVDPTMIAMSYVPGGFLSNAPSVAGDAEWAQAWRETGTAVGRLACVPLSPADRATFESRFYGDLGTLESYLGRILHLGRCIHARDADFRDAFWQSSLNFIAKNLDAILSQPRILYHQDVANLHVQQGHFKGFFDLEMCRVGCPAMQMGSALRLAEADHTAWAIFRQGWEAGTGTPLTPRDAAAVAAAGLLLGWREISRYLSYDGTPESGFAWAAPADSGRYRRSFAALDHLLEVRVF